MSINFSSFSFVRNSFQDTRVVYFCDSHDNRSPAVNHNCVTQTSLFSNWFRMYFILLHITFLCVLDLFKDFSQVPHTEKQNEVVISFLG